MANNCLDCGHCRVTESGIELCAKGLPAILIPTADVREHVVDGECKSFAASASLPSGQASDQEEIMRGITQSIARGTPASGKAESAASADDRGAQKGLGLL